jgi:protein phosphatase
MLDFFTNIRIRAYVTQVAWQASLLRMNRENTLDTGGNSLRILRPSIVVLCGPAACGKSTFAQRHFRPTQIISSDWARALVCDDERDQRFNTQAFALVHFLVEQRLTLNRLCVVDSTALTSQARKDLLDLARKCQVPTTLLLFSVPLETCAERDEKRQRSVGRAIVERQYEAFDQAKGTIRQEGFDQVVELQDADLEKVQVEVLFRPIVRTVQRPQRPGGPPRRFERPAQPFRPRPSGPRENVQPASAPSMPVSAPPVGSPQPAANSVSVLTPKVESPHPPEVPALASGARSVPAVHTTALPVKTGTK